MQVFAKVTGLHQLELKVIVSIFMGCWELNSGSLEDQQVLLTSEPFFHIAASFDGLRHLT